jgi:glycosyltransferase involved in cell wall biosynthesis
MKKILFITHNASQSGAPLVLLYLMQWLKKNQPNYVLDILFVEGGLLEKEFNKVTNEQFYISKIKPKKTLWRKFRNKFFKHFNIQNNKDFYNNIAKKKYDIIYSNTVVSAKYGNLIKEKDLRIKHLVHVHELKTIIDTLSPNFKNIVPNIDYIIAVSKQVEQNLIKNFKVQKSKVSVVYECAKINILKNKKSNNTFVVGACGLSYWRKGNDLFLQVARYINKNFPDLDIQFIWVGNEYSDKPIIDSDIEKLGLKEKVFFIGETSNTAQYFNNFDVFLMLSREDPFPLVCIEAAHYKIPILCFEKASGTSEVIKNGGGFVVPYLDIEAIGEKIIYYYKNPEKRIIDGQKAFDLFKDYTPENICPKYYNIIIKTLTL